MADRADWEKTGKSLGSAFLGLGKAILQTAEEGLDKAEDALQSDGEKQAAEETVFNDGTWRETGKSLGKAFGALGATLLDVVSEGTEKLSEWAEETKEDLEKAVDELNKESDAGEACEATEATCSEAETTNT